MIVSIDNRKRVYAYETIIINGSVISLNPIVPPIGEEILESIITTEDGEIIFKLDKTNPIDGHKVNKGSFIVLECYDEIIGFRAINTGVDAKIKVSYYSKKVLNY